jgi:hypothetical protein
MLAHLFGRIQVFGVCRILREDGDTEPDSIKATCKVVNDRRELGRFPPVQGSRRRHLC